MRTLQRRRELRRHTAALLDALGPDRQAIAARLNELGVQGVPGDPGGCAIAAYLSAVVTADPAVRAVRVMPARVVLCPSRSWTPPVVVALNDQVRDFVAAFDRNDVPELVRPRPASEPPHPDRVDASDGTT